MSGERIQPLEITVDIGCSVAHAFDTWCRRIALWWPKGHSVSQDPDLTVVLEQRVGGRIYERTSAGHEIDWGEVTVWEPPDRLEYLWHIGKTRADATVVDLQFLEIDDTTTRLRITHSGWERLRDQGQQWRDANAGGWNGLLPHFLEACG